MNLYEFHDPRFHSLVLPNAELDVLGDGFRWLEGPAWFPDHELLLFSDVPNNIVMRWCDNNISVFQYPSNFANGHARDREGRLISCLHHGRAITRRELDGSTTILAHEYEGKRLNAPNDVIVQSGNGAIWFTDPPYGINTDYEGGKQKQELPASLYRLDPQTGLLQCVSPDFIGPNGIALSPDESRLYVTETGDQFAENSEHHVKIFDLRDETLTNGRIFARISPGYADGLACDADGNLWCGAGDGVHCLSPDGELLGKILTGGVVSNITFGGRHLCRLFICTGTRLLALYTNTRGIAWQS
ncbi:MAG: SMP-30/gluconolactonase/LRE family protein [Rhodospirillales bacterium]|nr:SMP-30/gluconolactonase/LRE family protein [Rhodospirillales bacterium]